LMVRQIGELKMKDKLTLKIIYMIGKISMVFRRWFG